MYDSPRTRGRSAVKDRLPLPPVFTVLVQCVVFAVFAWTVWFFLTVWNERNLLEEAVHSLDKQNLRIDITERQLEQFNVLRMHYLPEQMEANALVWEHVDVDWRDISFLELVHRIEGFYSTNRLFVLESFKMGIGRTGNGGPDKTHEPQESSTRWFQMKGKFLCSSRDM